MDSKEIANSISQAYECAKKHGFSGDTFEVFFPIDGMTEKDVAKIMETDPPITTGCRACCGGGKCGICCTFPL